MSTSDNTPAGGRKRLTAAERQAIESARLEQAKLTFEADRSKHWLTLWLTALRIGVLLPELPRFCEEHSWWTQDFRIDGFKQSFRIEGFNADISESSLKFQDFDRIRNSLERGLELLIQHLEELERERLERKRLQEQALAKLTDEEARALGFSR
jgi:hypothetical protein